MSEEMVVRQCAPTLAGIKAGSLFPCPCTDRDALLDEVRQLNRRLSPKGLCLLPLRFTEGSGNPLENEHVKAVTAEVEAALGKRGRVLLRKSGPEPLIRVMVEGEHEDQVHEFAHRIAEAVKSV